MDEWNVVKSRRANFLRKFILLPNTYRSLLINMKKTCIWKEPPDFISSLCVCWYRLRYCCYAMIFSFWARHSICLISSFFPWYTWHVLIICHVKQYVNEWQHKKMINKHNVRYPFDSMRQQEKKTIIFSFSLKGKTNYNFMNIEQLQLLLAHVIYILTLNVYFTHFTWKTLVVYVFLACVWVLSFFIILISLVCLFFESHFIELGDTFMVAVMWFQPTS